MLLDVAWPSPKSHACVRGWRYDESVTVEDVANVSAGRTVPEHLPVGGTRWREWILGRRAVDDALQAVKQPLMPVLLAPSGAPMFPDPEWSVSISHTRGLVLAVVAPVPVGIDVESSQRDVSRLARVVLASERVMVQEIGLLAALVAKEAASKSLGQGLHEGVRRWPIVDTSLDSNGRYVTVASPDGKSVGVHVWENLGYVTGLACE